MVDLINDYRRYLERRRRSEDTITTYIGVLRRMDDQLPEGLAVAVAREIEDWIFAEARADSTYQLYISIVRGFGKWATDPRRPRLDRNEAALLDPIRAPTTDPKPVTEAHLTDILARSRDPFRIRMELAAFAGLRCIEIGRLDREHITESQIKVLGKGSKWRPVPTHPLIWTRVKDLPAGPVTRNVDGSRPSGRQVSHNGNGYLGRLGYPQYSMHCLRHRFATRAYDGCRDLAAVQDLLGHADPATTRRYVQVNAERQAAAVRGLPLAS